MCPVRSVTYVSGRSSIPCGRSFTFKELAVDDFVDGQILKDDI
jgi:hypothetical protein